MKKIIALMILIIVSALSFGCEDESKADNNSSNAIITIGETEEDLGISPEEFRTSFNGHVNSFAQELEKEKLGVNFKNFEIYTMNAPDKKGENGSFVLKNSIKITYSVSENKKLKKVTYGPEMSTHTPNEHVYRMFTALAMLASFTGDEDASNILTELINNYNASEKIETKEAFYELKDKGVAMYNYKDLYNMYVFSILTKKDFEHLKSSFSGYR